MGKRTFGLLFSLWAMIAMAQASELTQELQYKSAANPLVTSSGLAVQRAQWSLAPVAKVQMADPSINAERYLCGGTERPCVGTLSATASWGRSRLSVIPLEGWTPYFINRVTSFVAVNFPSPDSIQLFDSCLSEAQPELVTVSFGFCLRRQDLILNQTNPEPLRVVQKKPVPETAGISVAF